MCSVWWCIDMSEKTIKVHRGKTLHTMQAESLPDLVRMAGQLGGTSTLS